MNNLRQFYQEFLKKQSAYSILFATANFDESTIAPKKGSEARGEALSIVYGDYMDYICNAKNLEKLKAFAAQDDLTEIEKESLRRSILSIERMINMPSDLIREGHLARHNSIQSWEKAKKAQDYGLFKNDLEKIINITKKELQYMPSKGSDYNTLLDLYEPFMTSDDYDQFFDVIKKRLVPFIQEVMKQPKIDNSALSKPFPIELQRKLTEKLKEFFKFDSEKLYLAESTHPFSSTFSRNDGRITTKYLEELPMSNVYAFIHEFGHATYGIQTGENLINTPCEREMSMGMHESQSRFLENYIGRSKAFTDQLYDMVEEVNPGYLTMGKDEFYRQVNASELSYIRIEADELTYALHILVRYEVEKAIFNGKVDVSKLDELWNEKFKAYFGFDVKDDANGILQDIHFSQGSFGYFPTYLLGTAFAAQFNEQIRKDLDVDSLIENHQFDEIKKWLEKNIHQYGALYSSKHMVKQVSGKEFDANIFVDYLIDKYSKIYNMDK